MFTKTSRYYDLQDRIVRDADGRERVYKERRLVPRGASSRGRTAVGPSERLDLIAARAIGRSDLFWRLCDVNDALDPFSLTETTGRLLRVPDV